MDINNLPADLITFVGSEKIDFVLKGKRKNQVKHYRITLFLGIFWSLFMFLFSIIIFGPLLQGKKVLFEINDVPTTAGPDDLQPLIGLLIFTGIFFLIGFGILGWSIYSILREGGIFVGTKSNLVHYQNGKIESFDWGDFTGNIDVKNAQEDGTASIILELKNYKRKLFAVSLINGRIIHPAVFLSHIANANEIEQYCRKRINEFTYSSQ